MSAYAKILACAGLVARATAVDFINASPMSFERTDNWPYGVNGSVIESKLEKPIASHNTSIQAFSLSGNSSKEYVITTSVIEISSNDTDRLNGLVSTQAFASIHGPADANLDGIDLCYQVWIPDDNQTFFDQFAQDDGDCASVISSDCLTAFLSIKCGDNADTIMMLPPQCEDIASSLFGSSLTSNYTASSVVNSDVFFEYSHEPHKADNDTETNLMASKVFPILTGWTNKNTGISSSNFACLRAKASEPAGPTTTTTSSAPSSTPSTTSSSSSYAQATAAVRADIILGAAAAVVGYMAC